jgi:hypothetical protein
VVVSVAEPDTTPEPSPFTKPVIVSVNVGLAAPNARDALFAVTFSTALAIRKGS